MMSLREAAMVLGSVASADASARFLHISIDSRELLPGSLFVALRGPNHDGHDHLGAVAAAGACGAVVEQRKSINLPQLVVSDTRVALARLAEYWRQRWPLKLVAITGSNGKTTVKEMTGKIVASQGPALITEGNQNNEVGVPLTLLRARPFHQFAVIEMGMSNAGELARLSTIGRPDIAVITNAGSAHLENFRDRQALAQAKGEIFNGLRSDGVAVINADDPAADLWRELAAPRSVIDFALDNPEAAIRGDWRPADNGGVLEVTGVAGEWRVELGLFGRENGANALAAIAVGFLLKVPATDMAVAIASCKPVSGRLQLLTLANGGRLIDDSYNASPDSLRLAIEVLAQQPGKRILILGDMAELGTGSADFHREAGRTARAAGIDQLLTLGEMSELATEAFGAPARHCRDLDSLLLAIGLPQTGDTLLVKGSRSAGMERVVTALTGQPKGELHAPTSFDEEG